MYYNCPQRLYAAIIFLKVMHRWGKEVITSCSHTYLGECFQVKLETWFSTQQKTVRVNEVLNLVRPTYFGQCFQVLIRKLLLRM